MSSPVKKQLEFSFFSRNQERSPENGVDELEIHRRRIEGYLSFRMPEPVDVVFTNNRSTMISFKRRAGRYAIRLHRLFRHADQEILESLALYLVSNDKVASQILDKYISLKKDEICSATRSRIKTLRTKGKYYDLSEILKRVSLTYFGGEVDVSIGWGRRPRRHKRRRGQTMSRALATYDYGDRVIRVSPVLDGKAIPEFILDWIVYHEILHHVLPVEVSGGRKRYHTQRFRALERAFVRYEDAKAWENANLEMLLF